MEKRHCWGPPALTHYSFCLLQFDIVIHQGFFSKTFAAAFYCLRLALGKQIPKPEERLDKTSWIYRKGHEASVYYPLINDNQALSAVKELWKMDLNHLWVEDDNDRMFKEVKIMCRGSKVHLI